HVLPHLRRGHLGGLYGSLDNWRVCHDADPNTAGDARGAGQRVLLREPPTLPFTTTPMIARWLMGAWSSTGAGSPVSCDPRHSVRALWRSFVSLPAGRSPAAQPPCH